jgi:hypothetical protein
MERHPMFCVRRFNIVEMATPQNWLMDSMQILSEFPMLFFAEIDKWILKFIWKYKGSIIATIFCYESSFYTSLWEYIMVIRYMYRMLKIKSG